MDRNGNIMTVATLMISLGKALPMMITYGNLVTVLLAMDSEQPLIARFPMAATLPADTLLPILEKK
ncbi:MAG: hypothetical protein ACI9IP_001934 [Arcticibacterium sp.]|jgi:hypothetical protein